MKNSRDVNKMGVREYDYIRGNTALAPDKKIKETEKQRKKQRIQSKKRERAMKKNILIAGFTVGTILFALGSTTLFLDSKIYDYQKKLLILEENLKEEKDVNAAINVKMLKFASFDKIKSTAEDELGMIYPNSESTITIDMSKENAETTMNEAIANVDVVSRATCSSKALKEACKEALNQARAKFLEQKDEQKNLADVKMPDGTDETGNADTELTDPKNDPQEAAQEQLLETE